MRGVIAIVMLGVGVASGVAYDARMVPRLWDARMGRFRQINDLMSNGRWIEIKLPEHAEYDGLTVTMWLKRTNDSSWHIYPCSMYCPVEVSHMAPDLLTGCGRNLDLDAEGGGVSFASVGFRGVAEVSKWPMGVATIAGTSEQPITVSVGGNECVVSGEFNRNIEVGPSDTVAISGGGKCDVQVSQTPCYRFYGNCGFNVDGGAGVANANVDYRLAITNSYRFVVWRVVGDVSRIDVGSDVPGVWSEKEIISGPASDIEGYSGKLSGKGMYRLSVFSLVPEQIYDLSMFDARVFGRRLTDGELERIHINGVQELRRRGVVGD